MHTSVSLKQHYKESHLLPQAENITMSSYGALLGSYVTELITNSYYFAFSFWTVQLNFLPRSIVLVRGQLAADVLMWSPLRLPRHLV